MLADEVKASDGVSRRTLSTDVALQSHDFVGTIIKGRSKDPGAIALTRICEAYSYNVRWLLTGLGPKFVDRRADEMAARERNDPPPPPRGTPADEAVLRVLDEKRPERRR